MPKQEKESGSAWPTVAIALAVTALVISAFGASMMVRDNLQLGERVTALEAEIDAMEEELGEGGHDGNGLGLDPTIEFTLMAYLTGFVGVGGDIANVMNPLLQVRPGDVVHITVINGEDVEHDFVIAELEVHSEHLSVEGAQDEMVFIVPSQGTFSYFCSVPGHRGRGMEGTLAVVP